MNLGKTRRMSLVYLQVLAPQETKMPSWQSCPYGIQRYTLAPVSCLFLNMINDANWSSSCDFFCWQRGDRSGVLSPGMRSCRQSISYATVKGITTSEFWTRMPTSLTWDGGKQMHCASTWGICDHLLTSRSVFCKACAPPLPALPQASRKNGQPLYWACLFVTKSPGLENCMHPAQRHCWPCCNISPGTEQ